jgi:hypothetical protein
MLKHHRALIWIGWPIVAAVSTTGIVRLIVHQRGWGLYWAWGPKEILQTALLLFGPPAVLEVFVRLRRNNG